MQRPSFSLFDASAGSGKTYALVKEYLKIILVAQKNDAYRNILAITFTNKAVHEMKSRIVGNLSEFATEKPNQKAQDLMCDLAAETKLSVDQIQIKPENKIVEKPKSGLAALLAKTDNKKNENTFFGVFI